MAHYAPLHYRELLFAVRTYHTDVTLTLLSLDPRSSRRTSSLFQLTSLSSVDRVMVTAVVVILTLKQGV